MFPSFYTLDLCLGDNLGTFHKRVCSCVYDGVDGMDHICSEDFSYRQSMATRDYNSWHLDVNYCLQRLPKKLSQNFFWYYWGWV